MTPEKLAAVEADLAQAQADLAAVAAEHEALLAQVAADLAIETLSEGDAAKRTRPSEQRLEQARRRVEQLSRAVPELHERLAAQQQRQREERARAAAKALANGCGTTNTAAETLARKLREADEAAQALVRQRAEVDRLATSSAGARLGDGVSSHLETRRRNPALGPGTGRTPPDGWLDEPGWGEGIETLRQVLEAGPRQPLAASEARARAKAREVEGQEREIRNWLRVDPVRRARQLVATPDGVPDSARREAETILAEAARSAAASAGAHAAPEEEDAYEGVGAA